MAIDPVTAGALVSAGTNVLGGIIGGHGEETLSREQAQLAAAQQLGLAQGLQGGLGDYQTALGGLDPYQQAGANALQQQVGLMQDPSSLVDSPLFQTALAQGNRNILANASATGGLRGGNVQQQLGELAPQLMLQQYNQQMQNLGSMASQGLGATQSGISGAGSVLGVQGQIGQGMQGGAATQEFADSPTTLGGAWDATKGFLDSTLGRGLVGAASPALGAANLIRGLFD